MTDIASSFLVPGQIALVTGGGSGIGQEIALVLALAGAEVIATDVNEDGLVETRARAEAEGISVAIQRLDVSDPDAVNRAVGQVVEQHGRLDILVNSAGVMTLVPALDVTPEELRRVLGINLDGTFYACQAAGRVMTQGGRIINLASAIVDRASAGRVTYAMSKGAIVQLTRTLAVELGEKGVRVNAIAPGWVESGITKQHWTDADGNEDQVMREAYRSTMAKASPLMTVGTVRDIALSALQLASAAGSFITGQVIRVNGGTMMV
ncbi:SDR family NAD(P)-dependent oxidoreductase [Microbacterium sp.]|uniref:SDR family NAD(P)-dependent oxidoreductase n=1 Tax=Microbacterium sp. TaxID=51671 RepID=UPI002733415B|nr:SDR family NAD(P)-dependent oxidoreductase [Microbacterium sp.]MDP3950437.1 SDR family NAD(P)-dependent oxidoreductase [Microbacterium sp.]